MDQKSVELLAVKSEPESEPLDCMAGDNVELCMEHCSVKQELVDDASLTDLTNPGGDLLALPMEGMFELHAVKSEGDPRRASPPMQLGGVDHVTARRVKGESDVDDPPPAHDPVDTPPETAQTSSHSHKSLVDEIVPTDHTEVKSEGDCSIAPPGSRANVEVAEKSSPRGGRSTEKTRSTGRDRPGPSGYREDRSPRKRPRSEMVAAVNRRHEEMASAKLELVALKLAIAKNKLRRLKSGSTIEAAEASLRKTQHKLQLQTIRHKYERELEKDKLRAEISRIDMEIERCILMKGRSRSGGGPDAN